MLKLFWGEIEIRFFFLVSFMHNDFHYLALCNRSEGQVCWKRKVHTLFEIVVPQMCLIRIFLRLLWILLQRLCNLIWTTVEDGEKAVSLPDILGSLFPVLGRGLLLYLNILKLWHMNDIHIPQWKSTGHLVFFTITPVMIVCLLLQMETLQASFVYSKQHLCMIRHSASCACDA